MPKEQPTTKQNQCIQAYTLSSNWMNDLMQMYNNASIHLQYISLPQIPDIYHFIPLNLDPFHFDQKLIK